MTREFQKQRFLIETKVLYKTISIRILSIED